MACFVERLLAKSLPLEAGWKTALPFDLGDSNNNEQHMQLERYELTLETNDEDRRIFHSPARGALLHGLLMREIGNVELHAPTNSPRPFSQYLSRETESSKRVWTINLLHEKAYALREWILELQARAEKESSAHLHIEHYDSSIKVSRVQLTDSVSYEELFDASLTNLPPKFSTFDFITPLIFKKAGQQTPHPFPEARLIVQSALSRWNAFSDCAKFEEPEILEEISRHVSLFSFRLRSQHVAMDRIDFVGSVGALSFVVHRFELRQIFDLCGRYAEFCGIGAKTAMGLGATKYLPQELKREGADIKTSEVEAAMN